MAKKQTVKSEAPATLLIKDEEGNIKEVKTSTVVASIAKEVGNKKKDVEDVLVLVVNGKELELPEDIEKTDAALLKRSYKMLAAAVTLSEKLTAAKVKEDEAAAKAEAALKEAADKKNNAIVLASSKAHALSAALTDQAVNSLQKVLGKNFVVSNTGLTIADGVTITEENMATLIATLATSSEGLDDIRAITLWNLGDAVVALEDNFPERAEMIILAAVHEDGKQKHTVQCAVATCRKTPHDRRFPELTFTHHQEIANYAHLIKPKKTLDKIINDARFHKKVEVKLADGSVIEQWRPMSCAALRTALREAAGIIAEKKEKTEKETPEPVTIENEEEVEIRDDAPAATRGFIYIETASGDAFASLELSSKALESGQFAVLDLDAKRQLLSDGSEGDQIMQLPVEWFDEVVITPEKPKAAKKVAKAKKEKPAPEPEPETTEVGAVNEAADQ